VTTRIVITAIALFAFQPLDGLAQPAANPGGSHLAAVAGLEQSLVDTIARAEPSVVAVSRATRAQQTSSTLLNYNVFGDLQRIDDTQTAPPVVAAGVIIDTAGLVLTQYLAVHEGDEHTVTTIDGNRYVASIRAADPRSGLAVLAIDPTVSSPQRAGATASETPRTTFPTVRFGDAAQLRKGKFVIAIGNPYGVVSDGQPTASWGIVTNLARKVPAATNLNNAPGPLNDYRTTLHHLGTLIQTDAKLGWSAGGGALVNLQGELVGLTTTVATIAGHEQPAGYAIPMNSTMRRIIDTLKQGHEVEYGMLGISFGTPSQSSAERGDRVVVGQVFPGGPAARGGIQTGDILTRVNERPVADSDALQLAVSALPPGTSTTVNYERGGRAATTTVSLTKLAVAGKSIAAVRAESWRGIRVDYASALDAPNFLAAIESGAYDAEGCVLVKEVEPGSPAANAGIRRGMFISHVGDQRVTTPKEFHEAVSDVREVTDLRLTQPLESPTQTQPPDPNNPNRPDATR
jgi:serine protease Do